jgi:hypothetical protein
MQAVAEGDSPQGLGPNGEPEFKPVFCGGALTPAREQLAALGAAVSRRDSDGEPSDSRSDGGKGGDDDEGQEPKRRRATRHMGAGRPVLDPQPELSFLDSPEPAPRVPAAQRKRRMTTAAPTVPAAPASPPPAGLQARLARARRATLAPGALSRMAAPDVETPTPAPRPVAPSATAAAAQPSSAPRSQERPPWNVDTGKAPPTGGAGGGSGGGGGGGSGSSGARAGGAATGVAERSDRAAVARLQAQLESRCEEIAALQQALKDAEAAAKQAKKDQQARDKQAAQEARTRQALERRIAGLEREAEATKERAARADAERTALLEQVRRALGARDPVVGWGGGWRRGQRPASKACLAPAPRAPRAPLHGP